MAARFVVCLAMFALCHSSPLNDIRDGRSLSKASGSAFGYGGEHRATANVHGNEAHATGTSNNGAGLARDGLYQGQGQAHANAQYYDQQDPAIVDIARAQGFYHPQHVAQPAVITYNQNFVPNEQLVQPLFTVPGSAKSSATINGALESSQSISNNNEDGAAAVSNAYTSGNYGQTATNTRAYGNNNAASDAQTGLGTASVSSKASGFGAGNSFASSNALTKGINFAQTPTDVIVAKNQGFYNAPNYNTASSNAHVNGNGLAESSAKTGPARKSIHWHFGTAYDIPAGYGAIKSAAPVAYQTPIVYQAEPAELSPYGAAKSSVNIQGDAYGLSTANLNNGFGSSRSTANSQVDGSAVANADINNYGNGLYRSGATGSGIAKTAVNTNGLGSADAKADLSHGSGISKSTATSNGGFSNANSATSNQGSGLYRSAGEGTQWGNQSSGARVSGHGSAASKAYGNAWGLKTADSSAKSNGRGSSYSHANSQ